MIMLRKFLILSSLFFASCCLFVGLYFKSQRVNYLPNGFLRKFPEKIIKLKTETDLPIGNYYFVGFSDSTIILANSVTINELILINLSRLTSSRHLIRMSNGEVTKFNSPIISMDSTTFRIADGGSKRIFEGYASSWTVNDTLFSKYFFNDIIFLNSKSWILKVIDKNAGTTLAKYNLRNGEIDLHRNLLTKQIDGIMCKDGMIKYNDQLKKIIYVYYYRNQYLVTDTNLKCSYYGTTIDTVTKAKIKVSKVGNTGEQYLASPSIPINRKIATFGNFLFVNSTLIADNEDKKAFERNSVVDVYSLQPYKYEGSFYLSDEEKNKMRDFRVIGDKIYVLYEKHLCEYSLNLKKLL